MLATLTHLIAQCGDRLADSDGGKQSYMAINRTHIDATPEQVWDVISDASTYRRWVVGAKDVRSADSNWPEEGAALHHTSGAGPANIKDRTTVIQSTPARRIKLRAGLRPIGVAEVILDLRDDGSGTEVTMREELVEGVPRFVQPIADLALRSRNIETLRRLGEMAKERPRPTETDQN